MIKLLIACFVLLPAAICAQTYKECITTLDSLYDYITQTPSYKEQMKGDAKKQYAKKRDSIRTVLSALSENPTVNQVNPFMCFYQLSGLLMPLKDNHLFLYQKPVVITRSEQLKDSAFVQQLLQSEWYQLLPEGATEMAALEPQLQQIPADSVEGIYWYDTLLKIGIRRLSPEGNMYEGVVLHSSLPHWKPNQLVCWLIEYQPKRFRAIHANVISRTFALYRNEKWIDGTLTRSGWKKDPRKKDYCNIPFKEPKFQFRQLNSQVQYLRLGSFATSNKSLVVSEDFYNQIKDSLTAPHLIVDLRNNGGGGFKASLRFLKLLRNYADHGKIYAIINNGTYSNAEQFSILLKEKAKAVMLGLTTNGTLTYGSNYGRSVEMAGGTIRLYITDMKDDGNFLPYEDIGLEPDILLSLSSNWIEQVLKIIANP